jgi:general secretion pathway protein D
VITDTSANVRRLVKVIAALDTAIDIISQVRVFPLQYANATDAARLINDVFDKDSSGDEQQPGFRAFFRGRGGPGGQQEGEPDSNRRADVPVRASADDRTNTVVVSAPPEVLDVIAEVLAELDANPASVQGVFVYKVIHGEADNLAEVLNNLFSTSNTTSNSNTSTAAARNTGRNGTSANNNAASRTAGGPSGGSGRFIEAIAAQLGAAGAETTTELVGQVTVVPDGETNSLLVMTAPSKFDRVRDIITQLDVPVPQVLIKVLVAEVTHNNGSDIGLEYSVVSDDKTVNVLQQFGIASALTSGLPGFSINVVNANLDLTLRALQEIGKLEVLSRPYILASDNQPAMITVGQEVPLITNTQFTELGGVRNTIRYEDVGIILNVTPHIGPGGLVTMDVAPEISALSGDTVQISEDYDAPVIAKRSAETRVALMSGQTIIIGGLMEDQKTQTRRQIPILGSIPLVGMLFSRNIEDTRKTELLIFLTPQIAEQPERLDEMTQHEEESVDILRDAVSEGTYDQHRRGMQSDSTPE